MRLRLHGRKWEWASAKWECYACIAIGRTPRLGLYGLKVEVNIAPEELESMDMDKIKAKYQEAQGAQSLYPRGAVVLVSRPSPVCVAIALYSVAFQRHCTPPMQDSSTRTTRQRRVTGAAAGYIRGRWTHRARPGAPVVELGDAIRFDSATF